MFLSCKPKQAGLSAMKLHSKPGSHTSVLECSSSLVWSKTVQSSVHISRWRESVLACKLGCWNPRGSQPSLWKCSVHARDLKYDSTIKHQTVVQEEQMQLWHLQKTVNGKGGGGGGGGSQKNHCGLEQTASKACDSQELGCFKSWLTPLLALLPTYLALHSS